MGVKIIYACFRDDMHFWPNQAPVDKRHILVLFWNQ